MLPDVQLVYIDVQGPEPGSKYTPTEWDLARTQFRESLMLDGVTSELNVIRINPVTPVDVLWDDVKVKVFEYHGSGRDIAAYMSIAPRLMSNVPTVFIGAHVVIRNDKWLTRMLSRWHDRGPGIYAPMASYQNVPHLRTACFMTSPKQMLQYPLPVLSRQDGYRFEHGSRNFSLFMLASGYCVELVTEKDHYLVHDWREDREGYWAGSQLSCMVWDRHCTVYDRAIAKVKHSMTLKADGFSPKRSFAQRLRTSVRDRYPWSREI